jgi:hypothetical protein
MMAKRLPKDIGISWGAAKEYGNVSITGWDDDTTQQRESQGTEYIVLPQALGRPASSDNAPEGHSLERRHTWQPRDPLWEKVEL